MRAQLRHQVRLGLEHLAHLVVDDLAQHHLDRDLTARHVLLVEEDVGEAAGTEHVDVRESRQAREAATAGVAPRLPPQLGRTLHSRQRAPS